MLETIFSIKSTAPLTVFEKKAFVLGVDRHMVPIKSLFRTPNKREWKHAESDGVLVDSLHSVHATNLQEQSQMSTCVLIWLGIDRASLCHW